MPPPLSDPRFVRKLSLLCCHCVRNIAYYRVGFVNEDGTGALKHQTEFGATANGNALDIAVLEWCKLFADGRAKHHWKRFVREDLDQKQFLADIYRVAGLNHDGWTRYLDKVRVYRDKFVAHLDESNLMDIPSLDVALESTFFLYAYVRARTPREVFDVGLCRHLPDDVRAYYTKCRDEARTEYGKLTGK